MKMSVFMSCDKFESAYDDQVPTASPVPIYQRYKILLTSLVYRNNSNQ